MAPTEKTRGRSGNQVSRWLGGTAFAAVVYFIVGTLTITFWQDLDALPRVILLVVTIISGLLMLVFGVRLWLAYRLRRRRGASSGNREL